MKHILCFTLCLYTLFASSQSNRLEGIIVFNNENLEGVNIRNISQNNSTISNAFGLFDIQVSLGDSLSISFLGMQDVTKIITNKEIESTIIKIVMYEKSIELKEVAVTKYSSINAVALGIIPEEMKDFSQYERRLALAGDFKPIHLLDLITKQKLQLDPIFNVINGRTKRMKLGISREKEENNFEFLATNYTEFASQEMKLKEKEIGLFFIYLVDSEQLENEIKNHQKEKFKFFLMEEWNTFNNTILENSTPENEKD